MTYTYDDFLRNIVDFNLPIHNSSSLWHMWSEPHRRYHDVLHLQHGFLLAREMVGQYTFDFDEKFILKHVLSAWCLHDAVYVVGSSLNEENSANLVSSYVSDSWIDINAVRKAVLKTKNHTCPNNLVECMVIDIDLWGLGSEYPAYNINKALVKNEYRQQYTEDEWVEGRIKFLNSFLGRNNIFWTPLGFKREAKARDNMQRELDDLLLDKAFGRGNDG